MVGSVRVAIVGGGILGTAHALEAIARGHGRHGSSRHDPTTLSDVYFRVGGPHVGKADIALEVNSDLIAFAQLTFAYSTEAVNGVPGKKVPGPPVNLPPPAGPEGTFASSGGGQGPGPIES